MNKMQKNDLLRTQIPAISKPNALILTEGVCDSHSESEIAEIMERVKSYNQFDESNDPWKEHDFGCFEFKNRKIFWKIDDYRGYDGYDLILTIMLASEY